MATKTFYGNTADGQPVHQFTLLGKDGLAVRCINYGCRLTHLFVPDANGNTKDILLGYDNLAGYETDTSFQGAFVGRYANRIAGAAFTLNGKQYTLPQNDGPNYLHGSFHQRVFEAEVIGDNSVSFTYTSPDGEDGFPGELWVGVTYTLTDQNELVLDYRAVAKADTYINFTNHSYFNLAGGGRVEPQVLALNSTTMLEVDAARIPTGRVLEVGGGAFDFTEEKPIGRNINDADPLLQSAGGYDHCYIIEKESPRALALAAIARDEASGRALHMYTTQPAVQLYTGNVLDSAPGKGGVPNSPRTGFCLETQHYPNSPANPAFPSTLLKTGEKFHEVTLLRF